MITCEICKTSYEYTRSRGDTKTKCASCRGKIVRYQRKYKLVQMLGGACVYCGYNKSLAALSFHHKDPSAKKFTISGNHARAWKSLRQEAQKCELVCCNCHMAKHHAYEDFIHMYCT